MKPGGLWEYMKSLKAQEKIRRLGFSSHALDRPAVLTVLPGVRNLADLRTVLRYVSAAPEERDYSVMGEKNIFPKRLGSS